MGVSLAAEYCSTAAHLTHGLTRRSPFGAKSTELIATAAE